jgi:hypothetical protein
MFPDAAPFWIFGTLLAASWVAVAVREAVRLARRAHHRRRSVDR